MANSVLIVGAGPMAVAYAKVLQDLKTPFVVAGRSEKTALEFKKETGVDVILGGLESYLSKTSNLPSHVINAVSEEALGKATLQLLEKGVKNLLVEKPGGFLPSEIRDVAGQAKVRKAQVVVGYNRRFYGATQKAKKLIQEDGGVSSFHFEFTEWGHVLEKLIKPQPVKEEWFLHNSTHLVDLAFYLCGFPKEMNSLTHGSLSWRKRAQIYTGSGISDKGALFSYHANWGAPGRFNLEILTTKNRYIFRPVEKLQVQRLGTVAIEEIPLDDDLDTRFKPGIYRQTQAFLNGSLEIFPTIDEQAGHLKFYEKMENLSG